MGREWRRSGLDISTGFDVIILTAGVSSEDKVVGFE